MFVMTHSKAFVCACVRVCLRARAPIHVESTTFYCCIYKVFTKITLSCVGNLLSSCSLRVSLSVRCVHECATMYALNCFSYSLYLCFSVT